MGVLEIHPGRQQVAAISLGGQWAGITLEWDALERGLKAAVGGAFRLEVEPLPDLPGHVLVMNAEDRNSHAAPAFYLKADPACLINGIGIVIGRDAQGRFAEATTKENDVLARIGFVKQVDQLLTSPVLGQG